MVIRTRGDALTLADAPSVDLAAAGGAHQRSDGGCAVSFARDAAGVTRLAGLYQHDPCRVLFPYPEPGDLPAAVVVTTSGGLAGGDRVRIDLAAGAGAAALVTTQAAEKVYRSLGAEARVEVSITVGAGAWLEWLPHETILFDRARLRRTTLAEVAPGGRLLAAESVVFGRTAHGERFSQGLLHDRWQVRRAGRLIWTDTLRLEREIAAVLAHPAGFGGAVACATLLYVADDAADRLELARALLEECPGRAAATLVNGVLVVRLLDGDARVVRREVARFWSGFRAAVAGLPASVPRLWYI